MGLPIELVCAVNENDIFHRALSTGDFTLSENVVLTWSTAMDIQVMAYILITNHSRHQGDNHLISPYNITALSTIKVMRIKNMITKDNMSGVYTTSSWTVRRECM